MPGTIDAIFQQHERSATNKRDQPATPDSATVTSPVAQAAPKASKAAEGDGAKQKASGTARRVVSFAEYRIARGAALAAASSANDQQSVPAAEHNNLSEVLMDDSVTFGPLEGREDDLSINLDEAHKKNPTPDGRHAREWRSVVAASLIIWWGITLHMEAPPGAHAHDISMRIGGIPPPPPPPRIPPTPPCTTRTGDTRPAARMTPRYSPPAVESHEAAASIGRLRTAPSSEGYDFEGGSSPLRRRRGTHLERRESEQYASGSASETYACGRPESRPDRMRHMTSRESRPIDATCDMLHVGHRVAYCGLSRVGSRVAFCGRAPPMECASASLLPVTLRQDRLPLPGPQSLETRCESLAKYDTPNPRVKQWRGHVWRQPSRVHRADPRVRSASTVPRYEGYIDK